MPTSLSKPALILFLLISIPPIKSNAEIDDSIAPDNTSELKNIRVQIKDVEDRIKNARDEAEKQQRELRDNEIKTAEILSQVGDIELYISKKRAALEELQVKQAVHADILEQEKQKLIHQIRSAYKIGRNDYLKLLMNQEDPSLVGRAITYHDYHNKVRIKRIEKVKLALVNLEIIQSSIHAETAKLQSLKIEHETKLIAFKEYRTTRHDIISDLQKYINEQGVQLHTLQENERELEKLFQEFRQEQQAITDENFAETPPFNMLKGKLDWPIKGTLLKRFGNNKKGNNLKWQGVLIDAEMGTSVNAVSTGKVIFADWFRNLGLLIILDHGDGYMSLYGHNQNLLKNTGDWVLASEKIASVGDSGGQHRSALYFEIRKGAKPLDPADWCRG